MVEHDTDRGAEKIADGGTDGIKRKRGTKAAGNGRKEQNGAGRGQKGLPAAVFWRSLMIL